MSRSSKKKPFVQEKLLKRIEAMNETGEKEVLKTWSRASTIYPMVCMLPLNTAFSFLNSSMFEEKYSASSFS